MAPEASVAVNGDRRIVSFLPAATEIVCTLGGGAGLVGRSHECDFPAEVGALPVVSRPALDIEALSQAEIDSAVSAHLRRGESLYVVDERLLRDLAPDVILTQDLCRVCAPSGNELSRTIASLPSKPEVVYLTPRTLAEIDENILAVGSVIGRSREARALVECNRARVARRREATAVRGERTRVSFLEWTDPPYCAGHWVPEMIEIAGGEDRLSRTGEDSARITWDDIRAWSPELVIVAPCGYGLAEAQLAADRLPAIPGARVQAVDANAYFARPGPRYVDGIEVLAMAFQRPAAQ
jgi:iron complex transport system substrate-binding protein